MARRGRVIGAALGLLVIFLLVTSRNSGSHPRDLHMPARGPQEPLAPVIKEPAGVWDPVHDKFHDQQRPGPVDMGNGHEADEGLNRKSPKKAGQEAKADIGKKAQEVLKDVQKNDAAKVEDKKKGQDTGKVADMASNVKGQPDPQKPKQKPGSGSGAVVNGGTKEDDNDNVVIDEYDPAADLKVILTQAPVIIFSKTRCPHSKDAKRILLENHKISPAPFVVELDQHPNGPALQAHLGEVTGRRTVPNVIVNGVSIGGGDDMRALEHAGTVAETFLSKLAGKITVDGLSSV